MTTPDRLWDRYTGLVEEWADKERASAVTLYRRAHAPAPAAPVPASPLDAFPTTAVELLPPPARAPEYTQPPLRLPPDPKPPTLGNALAWGAGGGAVVFVLWSLIIISGWKPGSGHVLPILIIAGLLLSGLAGTATAVIRHLVNRSRFKNEMTQYHRRHDEASRAFEEQQRQALNAKAASLDSEADHLLWKQLQDAAVPTPTTAAAPPEPEKTDEEILAEFDAKRPALVAATVAQARDNGTAPESGYNWLGQSATLINRIITAAEAMTARGWTVTVAESTTVRDILTVTGPGLPADTTVVFHNPPPLHLRTVNDFIAVYDDATLSYRPIPDTDHHVPEACPDRTVHLYTHWPVRGLDATEDGYGVIGTDVYLTDWDHLIDTVATAEL